KDRQPLLEKDHLRGVAGHVHRGGDGDAYVSGAEAGASLTPSPRNPTTCPRAFSACSTRFFWAGLRRPKTEARSATAPSPESVIRSRCSPVTTSEVSSPTRAQTCRATRSPSPVSTLTTTPSL